MTQQCLNHFPMVLRSSGGAPAATGHGQVALSAKAVEADPPQIRSPRSNATVRPKRLLAQVHQSGNIFCYFLKIGKSRQRNEAFFALVYVFFIESLFK